MMLNIPFILLPDTAILPYPADVVATRLRRKTRFPDHEGMRVSSEALAKEDWSFGGLRRTEQMPRAPARGAPLFC
jgi:hypothetical protein